MTLEKLLSVVEPCTVILLEIDSDTAIRETKRNIETYHDMYLPCNVISVSGNCNSDLVVWMY